MAGSQDQQSWYMEMCGVHEIARTIVTVKLEWFHYPLPLAMETAAALVHRATRSASLNPGLNGREVPNQLVTWSRTGLPEGLVTAADHGDD